MKNKTKIWIFMNTWNIPSLPHDNAVRMQYFVWHTNGSVSIRWNLYFRETYTSTSVERAVNVHFNRWVAKSYNTRWKYKKLTISIRSGINPRDWPEMNKILFLLGKFSFSYTSVTHWVAVMISVAFGDLLNCESLYLWNKISINTTIWKTYVTRNQWRSRGGGWGFKSFPL